MLLEDKVVIISGIGPGLGIELALAAAKEGAHVVLAARTEANLLDAAKQVQALGLGKEVLTVPTDIADQAACKKLIDTTVEHFGRLDCLFNSAYTPGSMEMIEQTDLEGWRPAFEVNLFGTMQLSQYAVKVMKQQGGGAIVMINTMVTRKPILTQGGYAASKAALAAATAHLAQEVGRYNIRVNSTFMGWMWGAPVEAYFDQAAAQSGANKDDMVADVCKNIPLGKIPDDADCAKAAIMLATDYASAITGASLDVNGGEYIPY